jgi:peptidyl-prolyl cis-trans isomerase A (cyclophilin A)
MIRHQLRAFAILLLLALGTGIADDKLKVIRIVIETDKGSIGVELFAEQAPATVANFLRYVDGKFYDGGRFHRTVKPDNQPANKVKIEVIQAGINPEKAKDEFPPIKLERTRDTKLAHQDGTISMARDGPDTATSDFFLCIGAQPELDFAGKRNPDGQGFAAFGRVTKGMDVVKKIQGAAAKEQELAPPIKIVRIKRAGLPLPPNLPGLPALAVSTPGVHSAALQARYLPSPGSLKEVVCRSRYSLQLNNPFTGPRLVDVAFFICAGWQPNFH